MSILRHSIFPALDQRINQAKLEEWSVCLCSRGNQGTVTYLYDIHEQGEDGHDKDDLAPRRHPVQDPPGERQQHIIQRKREKDEDKEFHD